MKNLLLFLFIGFFISSCSIQKRQHLPGYHLTFHKKYTSSEAYKTKNHDLSDDDVTDITEDANRSDVTPDQHPFLTDLINEDEEFIQINLSKLNEKLTFPNRKSNSKTTAEKTVVFRDLSIKKKTKNKSLYENPEEDRASNLALIGFILSLAFIILGPLGLFTSIAGIVLCSMALKRMSPETKHRKLAKAGLIISIVTTSLFILALVFLLAFFFFFIYVLFG